MDQNKPSLLPVILGVVLIVVVVIVAIIVIVVIYLRNQGGNNGNGGFKGEPYSAITFSKGVGRGGMNCDSSTMSIWF